MKEGIIINTICTSNCKRAVAQQSNEIVTTIRDVAKANYTTEFICSDASFKETAEQFSYTSIISSDTKTIRTIYRKTVTPIVGNINYTKNINIIKSEDNSFIQETESPSTNHIGTLVFLVNEIQGVYHNQNLIKEDEITTKLVVYVPRDKNNPTLLNRINI